MITFGPIHWPNARPSRDIDARSHVRPSQVRQIVTNFSSTFTGNPAVPPCWINTKLTTYLQVGVKQYPLPFSMMEAEKNEVRDMIDLGIVEPSESPYWSPALIVGTKDNTNRFCIDFRTLNKITVFMPNQCEHVGNILEHSRSQMHIKA